MKPVGGEGHVTILTLTIVFEKITQQDMRLPLGVDSTKKNATQL